jgi:hypothetical protein
MSARQRSKRTAQAAFENEAEEIAIACVPFFFFFFFFFVFFVLSFFLRRDVLGAETASVLYLASVFSRRKRSQRVE